MLNFAAQNKQDDKIEDSYHVLTKRINTEKDGFHVEGVAQIRQQI